jgi:hypothetical protein
MITVTTYKLKPFLSRAETKELMAAFAQHGTAPGVNAHYVATDGSGGVVVSDSDDITGAYRNLLNYTQWVEYDSRVMLTIEQAVPLIMESLA